MANINIKGPAQVPLMKYKDLGDGTYAPVMALEAASIAGGAAAPTVTILSAQTAATGTNWTAFASTECTKLDLQNLTGTAIEYRRGGTGTAFTVPDGAARMIEGIADADEIEVRRVDTSNTQVTVQAEAFA